LISGRYKVMNYNIVFLVSLFLLVRCDMKKSIPIEQGFIKVKDAELYYMVVGKGEPNEDFRRAIIPDPDRRKA